MKALVGAFNQEKALVGAFSVIVQPVVKPMDSFTALLYTLARLLRVVRTQCGGRRDTLILLELVFMAASLLVCLATVLATLCSQVSHGSRVTCHVSAPRVKRSVMKWKCISPSLRRRV